MLVKTLVEFSGVPKGTTGEAERDEDLWKITWNLDNPDNSQSDGVVLPSLYSRTRPLVDWFDQEEFDRYLMKI